MMGSDGKRIGVLNMNYVDFNYPDVVGITIIEGKPMTHAKDLLVNLVVEQCITEAKKLFETVNDPHEWDVAVSYLKKRYGADAVDEAIKIEHLEM